MTAIAATADAKPKIFNPWLVAVAVSIATFMEVLDTTITNVSLSHISGSLGASQDESTWVLTSYLVANGIILPLSGWLSGVIGRKRFFMICIAAFTAASFACGAATSMEMLIFFRLLQGLAGGGLQPTQQAIILDAFPVSKRGAAFGVVGITMIVAPILGPTLGGYITDSYSWRWIFYLNIPVGIFALWMVGMMVRDPDHAKAKGVGRIDYVGLSLVALGLGALQITLDKGQQEDWFNSHFIIMFATISFSALACAVIWLLNRKEPIIDLRLLALPSFGMSCVMIFFTGFALYAGSALLPLLTQTQFGYDATLSGLVLSPGGMIVLFLMPLSGRLVSYVQARYMIAFGMVMLAFGMWLTSHITPQTDYNTFVLIRMSQVIGLPFLFIPIGTMAFRDIPKELSNKASALYSLFRNLGGSVGIAVIASFVSRHQQVNQEIMTQAMSETDANYQALVADYTQTYIDHGFNAAAAHSGAIARIYQEILHQAAVISYNDAFLFMSMIMIVLAGFALFMPKNDPHAKGDAAATAH